MASSVGMTTLAATATLVVGVRVGGAARGSRQSEVVWPTGQLAAPLAPQ
jgi:hypothetical protein